MRPWLEIASSNAPLADIFPISGKFDEQARLAHLVIAVGGGDPQRRWRRLLNHPGFRALSPLALQIAFGCADGRTNAARFWSIYIVESKADTVDVSTIGIVPIDRLDAPLSRWNFWR